MFGIGNHYLPPQRGTQWFEMTRSNLNGRGNSKNSSFVSLKYYNFILMCIFDKKALTTLHDGGNVLARISISVKWLRMTRNNVNGTIAQ